MRFAAGVLLISLLAGPAWAQSAQPVDPIDALLRGAARPAAAASPDDEETAERIGRPIAPQADSAAGLPSGPIPYSSATAPPPHLSEPITLDETGKRPDAPSVRDMAYETRLRSSFASAQGFQGPLDGSFVLVIGGRDAYALELVDRARGDLEGAWRDLRKTGASGFIDEIARTANGDISLRFGEASVTLNGSAAGQWSGRADEAGRSQAATLRRVAR